MTIGDIWPSGGSLSGNLFERKCLKMGFLQKKGQNNDSEFARISVQAPVRELRFLFYGMGHLHRHTQNAEFAYPDLR